MGITAPQARADFDVYTTPGEHTVNGRQWRTWCEPYSQTARCRTEIRSGGVWVFNNLTYLPAPAACGSGTRWPRPGTTRSTAGSGTPSARHPHGTQRLPLLHRLDRPRQLRLQQHRALRADPHRPRVALHVPAAEGSGSHPPPSGTYSVTHGPNTSNRVILTFDDCPKSLSAFKTTVKAATDMGVRLALFPTGDCLSAGRFDAAYARSLGHYVFNHSISHPDLTTLSYSSVVRQLGSPGVVTTYGRPPYGAYNSTVRRAYDAVGMRIWTWTVDTNDWRGKSTSQLISYVVGNAKGGDTVLMHMQWNGFNESAIRAMKSGLTEKGIGLCRNTGEVAAKPAGISC
nr:polysaccharide deacetylase family protein [Tessaracoccus coleopterorum]